MCWLSDRVHSRQTALLLLILPANSPACLSQMEKLQEKLAGLNTELEELEEELRAAIKGKGSKGNPDS